MGWVNMGQDMWGGKLGSTCRGVEELMLALDSGKAADARADVSRLCTTTWVLKDHVRVSACCIHGHVHEDFFCRRSLSEIVAQAPTISAYPPTLPSTQTR